MFPKKLNVQSLLGYLLVLVVPAVASYLQSKGFFDAADAVVAAGADGKISTAEMVTIFGLITGSVTLHAANNGK